MKDLWLSVVLPVHNGAFWLGATLESVRGEDCSGIEFIILDSSADEDCAKIVRSHAEHLAIDYRRCPEVLAWTAKTNLAVGDARAPYLSMLHQDDIWLNGRVAAIRASIAAHPEAVLHLNPSRIIDETGRALGLWRCPLRPGLVSADIASQRLLVQNFVAIPAPVIRRSAWLNAGGMDEALWYTADWDLYLKLLRVGPAAYTRQVTTAFRVHRRSLTVVGSRDGAAFRRQMEIVLDRHSAEAPPAVLEVARASIEVNSCLAGAASGQVGPLLLAIGKLLALSPRQIARYLTWSRILERALPRLRLRLAGRM